MQLKDKDGRSFLHKLIIHTNPHKSTVRTAIKLVDVNSTDKDGNTALHFSVLHKRRLNITATLLIHGANPNAANVNGDTPLHLATSYKRIRHLQTLLVNGASPNFQNTDGSTPLHLAVRNDFILASKILLLSKAIVDVKDIRDDTALHLASRKGSKALVRLLLDGGASTEQKNTHGRRPSDYIIENTRLSEIFAQHPLDSVRCDWFSYGRFWHRRTNLDVRLNYCLGQGFEVNSTDTDGTTVLHRLMQYAPEGRASVHVLVEHGADVNATANDGRQPLHLAVAHWRKGGAEALIRHNANVNAEDAAGFTPMHVAAARGRTNQLRLLVKNGANIDPQARGGLTPLHSAAGECKVDAVEFLLEQGANPTSVWITENKEKRRPENFAAGAPGGEECKKSIFKLLRNKGAVFEYSEDCKGWEKRKYQLANVAVWSTVGCLIAGAAGGGIGLTLNYFGVPVDPVTLAIESCKKTAMTTGASSATKEFYPQEMGGNCQFNVIIGGRVDVRN